MDPITFFVLITRDRSGGTFHVSCVDILKATRPMLTSAKLTSRAQARREAERLFGPLQWHVNSGQVQNYVIEYAEVTVNEQ